MMPKRKPWLRCLPVRFILTTRLVGADRKEGTGYCRITSTVLPLFFIFFFFFTLWTDQSFSNFLLPLLRGHFFIASRIYTVSRKLCVDTFREKISNKTKRYYSRESVPNTNISIIRAISTSHHLKTGTPIDHSRPTKNPHRITVTLRVARLYPIQRTTIADFIHLCSTYAHSVNEVMDQFKVKSPRL